MFNKENTVFATCMFETLNRNTVFNLQTAKRSHFDESSLAVFVLRCFGVELLHCPA
jgi:hypothetical protein